MKYLLVVLLSLVSLVGCSTPEEKRAYQLQRVEAEARRAAMTPRDKCLEQANSETRICHLGALSLPNINQRNQTQQQCSDREMAMQDRCYARFK